MAGPGPRPRLGDGAAWSPAGVLNVRCGRADSEGMKPGVPGNSPGSALYRLLRALALMGVTAARLVLLPPHPEHHEHGQEIDG